MIHYLKIERNYLERLVSGEKKAEIRINDRDYQLGDILKFLNPADVGVGHEDFYLYFRITHIHSGLGLERYYVALSVERCKEEERQ